MACDLIRLVRSQIHCAGSAPSARESYSMVCDPVTALVILFGGSDYAGGGTFFNDPGAYDFAANVWSW